MFLLCNFFSILLFIYYFLDLNYLNELIAVVIEIL